MFASPETRYVTLLFFRAMLKAAAVLCQRTLRVVRGFGIGDDRLQKLCDRLFAGRRFYSLILKCSGSKTQNEFQKRNVPPLNEIFSAIASFFYSPVSSLDKSRPSTL